MQVVNLFEYLKSPFFIEAASTKLGQKVKEVIYTYLIFIFLVVILFLLITLFDNFIVQHYYHYSIADQLKINNRRVNNLFGRSALLMISFVAPFFEEATFRLPLGLKKTGIGLSLSILTYGIIGRHFFAFDFQNTYSYVRLCISMAVLVLTIYWFPPNLLLQLKKKYFNYFFYFSAIAFAAMHIGNFMPFNNQVYLFYPLYILPQFLMGLCVGYIRMKHGFISGWALHALINLPGVLFLWSISQIFTDHSNVQPVFPFWNN